VHGCTQWAFQHTNLDHLYSENRRLLVAWVLFCQVALLTYHQVTTLVDFFPFNGARNYARHEKLAECGVNGLLMALPPIGFGWHIAALMGFGVVYYFVLFGIELLIWWVPYLTAPAGRWRVVYNRLLALATSDFQSGDTLAHWQDVHNRLHRGTITLLPRREERPVPNLEHTILHLWTLITAIVTAVYYCGID
jgi:hypothetical protein